MLMKTKYLLSGEREKNSSKENLSHLKGIENFLLT